MANVQQTATKQTVPAKTQALYEEGEHNCSSLEEYAGAEIELTRLYGDAANDPNGGSRALWNLIAHYENKVGA